MTKEEKNCEALNIVLTLKTSKQETRDTWRQTMLSQYPEDSEFIELAYKMSME